MKACVPKPALLHEFKVHMKLLVNNKGKWLRMIIVKLKKEAGEPCIVWETSIWVNRSLRACMEWRRRAQVVFLEGTQISTGEGWAGESRQGGRG